MNELNSMAEALSSPSPWSPTHLERSDQPSPPLTGWGETEVQTEGVHPFYSAAYARTRPGGHASCLDPRRGPRTSVLLPTGPKPASRVCALEANHWALDVADGQCGAWGEGKLGRQPSVSIPLHVESAQGGWS